MCFCRAALSSVKDPLIQLQTLNHPNEEPEILFNPPLRTGPRQEDPVVPRGRTAVRMHGAA